MSLILPCFNPPSGWEKEVVRSVKSIEKKGNLAIDLIIVNDGSTKNVSSLEFDFLKSEINTIDIIQYKENRGKGYALRTGVAKAKQDLMIYTDIDFPYTEDSFFAIYNSLKEGHEIVPGHRGETYYLNTPFMRKMISKFLRWMLKTFLKLATDDSQCGIKGFNKKGAVIFLDTQIDRFLFDLEFIKLGSKRKAKVNPVKVILKPNVVFSKVNIKILAREAVNFVKVLRRK